MANNDESFSSTKLWSKKEMQLWCINLFMGTCTVYASRVALPICASILAQEYGWNKSVSGTIMSCFFWGYTITQIVAGRVADQIGGERVLNITTLIWSLLTLFTPQLIDLAYWSHQPLFFLLLFRIATGVGQGFHTPSMASIVSRHLTATDKGRIFGICLAGSHFGSVIAGSFGSILLNWFGWRSLFHFCGLLSMIWWAVFRYMSNYTLIRNRVISANTKSTLQKSKSWDVTLLPMDKNKNVKVIPVPWKMLFSHPAFWAASIAQYAGANAYFTMFSWLPSYFSDNFPNAISAVYNTVPYLAIVVTSLMSPFIAARLISHNHSVTFARRVMEGTSLMLMALLLTIVSVSTNFYYSLIIFTLAMASRGLHHGGVGINPLDFAPMHTGSVFGIFNAFSSVTGFLGVYVTGWILHSTNDNWTYVFLFMALQCVVGALAFILFGTGNKII